MIPASIDSTDDGIAFTDHPTVAGWLVVTIDGNTEDTRIVSRDGADYIAWVGSQYRTRFLGRALKECAEDVRHQRYLHDRAKALHRGGLHSLAALSPAQFAYVLAARERELAGLSVNSPGRADMLRDEIQTMRDFANVHA